MTSTAPPVERAHRECAERFDPPACTTSAPGRVNLVGGHTDYNDGWVLPAAIDRRTAVAARERDDDRLRVSSEATDEERVVPLDGDSTGTWTDYVAGVTWALREEGVSTPGADLAIASDVPPGAGLASSAALEVAVAGALCELAEVVPDPTDLARTCRRAENEFVGVSCGVLDQFATVFGRADHALELDCRSLDAEYVPLDADRARLVAVDTNVHHELADSAYGERRATCERGVELLAAELDRDFDALRDVTPEAFARVAPSLPETVELRCRHVVRENERVREAADALRREDYETAGDRMWASHASLRDDYEVSCAELDAVVEIAGGIEGVYGARMTGGGFGGSVVALVRPDTVDAFREAVDREYPERTGREADVYACAPDDGLRVESV
ncbi:galactokinase [Halomarina litorea]|uniref:galactokinase n=1 Tax=Halomarina litorea TaxID=2961595 RepID=UPI0020C49EB1|nr:galactokinase [Halomarina sp. BCD28]